MLEIAVRTESGQRHVRMPAGELAGLVRRIGGDGDRFLVMERVPDLPDVFAQVLHTTGGDYTLEHRDGHPERHFQTAVGPCEDVVAALTGWARRDDDWDAGLTWSRLDLGPAPEVPPLDLDEDDRRTLEQRLRESLAGGYVSRAELAEEAEEYLVADDHRPLSPEQAVALADRMWRERVAEQSTWRGETDPERLARAFAALQEAGITARENFTCCHTCGQAEIGGVADPEARGFVYFHSQCTESAVHGHGMTLLYGGFDGSPDTTAAIGREVVDALAAVGLDVEWDHDPESALTVTPLDWRRRLIG